ncbi:alpha/beta fold hydrolase [Microbacterium fluvii]|uniref:Alpha/beta fold hydrolase n=1 Tax=Microbacterium fluvii TaxID=415215 RepID=A0ABW2HDD1_9MICO|nr:alpha/beta hydrolase [Microbacterium fluvii]MCU4672756.1 alpha/beta hydrolase [Microbacterium fluvii]
MPYLTIDDRTIYHEVAGSGEPLVLLHGGYCSLEVMRELGDELSHRFQVFAPERTGHGRTPDRDGGYTYAGMADETVAYLDALGIESAHVVGFSDGAVAGLLVARDHPERVRTLIAISGNLSTDAYVADDYPHVVVTPEAHAAVRREFDELSPDGPEHWEVVDAKLSALWQVEPDVPAASLAAIDAPTLVLGGEHDAIRHDHLELVADSIPRASLAIVPETTHMLVRERPREVAVHVIDFIASA